MPNVKTKPTAFIDHIRELLNQGRTQEALRYVEHLGQNSSVMENAKAVCLMRLGKVEQAVSLLRDVVFQGYICIQPEIPMLYQINFAAAMVLANKKDFAISLLAKPEVRSHPQAAKLYEAIRQWRKGLNLLEKFCYHIGLYSKKPVRMDFPAGEV